MKHIELISSILAAEQQARALADEAREKKLHLREQLQDDTESLRRDYIGQADRRVGMVLERETEHTKNAIDALNEQHRRELQSMEDLYAQNRDAWVQKLYAMVIDPA